ncbi:hypothetical protein RLPCCGM1_c1307 [Rhizobium leguminosarum bv. phaseoli CCGM1]|uniref:hypothetical protein n=1 Tax=Rhizobium phaseoli TaxID=396 RepID=UPI0004D8CADF|nr:hypothetical protein [Rhizobium phaseoli]KEC73191.1 hypothetical protein RLPCCGM1_c1307 [Rhizobium leguminosarum bv. phaseoli CCGM1]PWI54160.1 hypothetical protein B5K03_12015 [Rhizobium phaseoli]
MTAQERMEGKRVRASERAIRAALKAIQASGMSVDKLLITGGQIEIRCTSVEGSTRDQDDESLEKW